MLVRYRWRCVSSLVSIHEYSSINRVMASRPRAMASPLIAVIKLPIRLKFPAGSGRANCGQARLSTGDKRKACGVGWTRGPWLDGRLALAGGGRRTKRRRTEFLPAAINHSLRRWSLHGINVCGVRGKPSGFTINDAITRLVRPTRLSSLNVLVGVRVPVAITCPVSTVSSVLEAAALTLCMRFHQLDR